MPGSVSRQTHKSTAAPVSRQVLGSTQTLTQKQVTAFTPQQQQAVKILQLSSAALHDEVQSAIASNPFLESTASEEFAGSTPTQVKHTQETHKKAHNQTKKSFPAPTSTTVKGAAPGGSSASSGQTPKRGAGQTPGDNRSLAETYAEAGTLHTFLFEQANATPLSRIEHGLLEWLIDSIDSRGYLAKDAIDELEKSLPAESGIKREHINQLLGVLQDFEPVGVGARDLQECLLIQLNNSDAPAAIIQTAQTIIESHLDLLGKGDADALSKALSSSTTRQNSPVDAGTIDQASQLIRSFNPHPGADLTPSHTTYIQADLIVEQTNPTHLGKHPCDRWQVRLDGEVLPQFELSAEMTQLMQKAQDKAGYQEIHQEYLKAKWLVQNVKKRFQTLLEVAQLIVSRQQDYFDQGDVALSPMKLTDIATALGMHESTISRTVNDKYMLTPSGIIELKHFFSTALNTTQGDPVSARSAQALIKNLIHTEPSKKPLSDTRLTQILNQRGIQIARRTVAKYREQLHIPASFKRKPLKH